MAKRKAKKAARRPVKATRRSTKEALAEAKRRTPPPPKTVAAEDPDLIGELPRLHDFSRVAGVLTFSDFHTGCKLAIMPREGIVLDEGNFIGPSPQQVKLNDILDDFTTRHVQKALGRNGKYVVVFVGDVVDGVHHNALTLWSNNLYDQRRAAVQLLKPIVNHPNCVAYFHIRGTECHVGGSSNDEEQVAKDLGAIPDERGNHARYELWLDVQGWLMHFMHHIGATGNLSTETNALTKELVEGFGHSAMWGNRPADVIVRAHRHRYSETRMPTHRGYAISMTLPCFQGKTPFVQRIAGGRQSISQYGGVVIEVDQDAVITHPYIVAPNRVSIVEGY